MDSNKRCLSSMEKNLKKLELGDSSGLFFPTSKHVYESAKPQEFSLPMPVMKYIWENITSPEVYQKLIKSCKLFFLKNPILVIKNLYYRCSEWRYCNETECNFWSCRNKHKKIDWDNLNGKVWLSKQFETVCYDNVQLVSNIIPQIYQCSIQFLKLVEQHLTLNQLKFLSTGVKEGILYSCVIRYDDGGEYVSMEDIIKIFSGAEYFYMGFEDQSENGFCKSYDEFVVACNNVEKVELGFIPADFDVREFYQRFKSSQSRVLIIISSLGNVHHLNQVVDEILATKFFEFVPPVFISYDLSEEKFAKMKVIQEEEAVKYH